MRTIDRIQYAANLARGKRVLDIGGHKMPGCDPASSFAKAYKHINNAAGEYRIVDCQLSPEVDYHIDLNKRASIDAIRKVLDDYKPEVILCMETLEHVNYHYECMNQMAYAVRRYQSVVFVTIPNNGNWIFNALGWNRDHCVAFYRGIAHRFIMRSDLGGHDVESLACMQKYLWYWWMAYGLALGQPFCWGFVIRPKQ